MSIVVAGGLVRYGGWPYVLLDKLETHPARNRHRQLLRNSSAQVADVGGGQEQSSIYTCWSCISVKIESTTSFSLALSVIQLLAVVFNIT